MCEITNLLDYFNVRLAEDWARNGYTKEIAVDRQKLLDLLVEVEVTLGVLSRRNAARFVLKLG